jgi:hypothetical protein
MSERESCGLWDTIQADPIPFTKTCGVLKPLHLDGSDLA